MKIITLIIGLASLLFITVGCEEEEHEHHHNHGGYYGGSYDGYHQGYGYGRGGDWTDGYYHR